MRPGARITLGPVAGADRARRGAGAARAVGLVAGLLVTIVVSAGLAQEANPWAPPGVQPAQPGARFPGEANGAGAQYPGGPFAARDDRFAPSDLDSRLAGGRGQGAGRGAGWGAGNALPVPGGYAPNGFAPGGYAAPVPSAPSATYPPAGMTAPVTAAPYPLGTPSAPQVPAQPMVQAQPPVQVQPRAQVQAPVQVAPQVAPAAPSVAMTPVPGGLPYAVPSTPGAVAVVPLNPGLTGYPGAWPYAGYGSGWPYGVTGWPYGVTGWPGVYGTSGLPYGASGWPGGLGGLGSRGLGTGWPRGLGGLGGLGGWPGTGISPYGF